jgi:hypothetical protein
MASHIILINHFTPKSTISKMELFDELMRR